MPFLSVDISILRCVCLAFYSISEKRYFICQSIFVSVCAWMSVCVCLSFCALSTRLPVCVCVCVSCVQLTSLYMRVQSQQPREVRSIVCFCSLVIHTRKQTHTEHIQQTQATSLTLYPSSVYSHTLTPEETCYSQQHFKQCIPVKLS